MLHSIRILLRIAARSSPVPLTEVLRMRAPTAISPITESIGTITGPIHEPSLTIIASTDPHAAGACVPEIHHQSHYGLRQDVLGQSRSLILPIDVPVQTIVAAHSRMRRGVAGKSIKHRCRLFYISCG